jgi:MFS transporter, PPP family, 3-phenylpropionic acid transporter
MPSRRAASSFFANYFLLYVSFGILVPYLQLYLKARGFTPSRIGVLLGIYGLAGIAGPMFVSRLADSRTAYRALLVGSLAASAIAFVPLQLTTRFLVAALLLALMGASYLSAAPLLDSAVSRILPDPARQYGRFRVAGSIGFIIVSLFLQLGAVKSAFGGDGSGDSSLSILVAFCFTALCAAGAAAFLPRVPTSVPHPPATGHVREGSAFDLRFWLVIGVIFLGRFGMGAYYSFFSLYLRSTFGAESVFGGAGVSLLWAIGSVAEIAPMWFSGRLIARWGLRAVLAVSLAAITVRLGLFVIAPSLLVIALAQLLHAFTFGTFHTAAVSYVNSAIPAERRGLGMAIYNSLGVGCASFLASVAGGYIIEAHGYVALYLCYAAVPLGGILILFTKALHAGIFDPWKPRPS